ncbi:hypothetical protein GL259_13835 [Streptomyces sp. Tu 3180]|nr:hypothetical protein GL259_13835 [Streptomyces sp. Tu 3180]
MAVGHGAWAPRGSAGCPGRDGRRRNARLRGEGVGLYCRPSPRQLRRSSPKRMMLRSLTETSTVRGSVSVCGTGGRNGTKSAVYHWEREPEAR